MYQQVYISTKFEFDGYKNFSLMVQSWVLSAVIKGRQLLL